MFHYDAKYFHDHTRDRAKIFYYLFIGFSSYNNGRQYTLLKIHYFSKFTYGIYHYIETTN